MSKTEELNVLKSTFARVLPELGFARKGDSWYRRNQDTTHVVNLQKSNYGQQYYINLGVFINQLGEVKFPKENHCHIRKRADSLPLEKGSVKEAMDLEKGAMTDAVREGVVEDLLRRDVARFFDKFSSVTSIENAIKNQEISSGFMTMPVVAFFESRGLSVKA